MNRTETDSNAIADIKKALKDSEPVIADPSGRKEAAVALLISQGRNGADLLLIERARRKGDPWSGQMAFPGGRRERQDASAVETAVRETAEEIGISLDGRSSLGRLDDLIAPKLSHAHGLIISCHVFEVERTIRLVTNDEVHDTVWVSLDNLTRPDRHTKNYQPPDYDGEFPGFQIDENDERVIWGLTFRIICSFFRTLGFSGF